MDFPWIATAQVKKLLTGAAQYGILFTTYREKK